MAKSPLTDALNDIRAVASNLDYALASEREDDEETQKLAELHRKLDELISEFENR